MLFYIAFKRFIKDYFSHQFRVGKVRKQYVVPQKRAASVLLSVVFSLGCHLLTKTAVSGVEVDLYGMYSIICQVI